MIDLCKSHGFWSICLDPTVQHRNHWMSKALTWIFLLKRKNLVVLEIFKIFHCSNPLAISWWDPVSPRQQELRLASEENDLREMQQKASAKWVLVMSYQFKQKSLVESQGLLHGWWSMHARSLQLFDFPWKPKLPTVRKWQVLKMKALQKDNQEHISCKPWTWEKDESSESGTYSLRELYWKIARWRASSYRFYRWSSPAASRRLCSDTCSQ